MTRINAIDNMRGIAFIFMIIQHIFYFYDVSKFYETNYAKIPIINMSGIIARNLFIFLAGCYIILNYKNNKEKFLKNKFKRTFEILLHALIITIITYIYYPDFYVRFGILHFIGLGGLICSLIAPYPKLYILFAILFLFITPPKINNFIDTITGASMKYNMMDWFPLFEWIPLMLLGMYFMENVKIENLKLFDNEILNSNNILTYLGKNSLNLYTFHIIFLIILFSTIIK